MAELDTYAEAPQVADSLAQLRNIGWIFFPLNDQNGELTELVGAYEHPGSDVTDMLRLRSIKECLAQRIVDYPGHGGGVTWKHEDDLFSCVNELLCLPPPDATSRLVLVPAPRLWTPDRTRSPLPLH